jgi:alcohol dehydrogenase
MRAAVYRSFGGKIAIETLPRPACPADGVVVEVKATGVCRSDWHGWKGHDADIVEHGLPFVPGHELAGCVVEVGESVGSLQVGYRVAVPFILSCGCCRECGRGRPTICESQQQPGFTQHGSFAEFVALPRADRNLCRIPDGVSYVEAAALGCRTTTAYRAVLQRGRLRGGESLAIFGCGGLGLSAVMIASAEQRGGGAAGEPARGRIIAVDVSHEARSKALELGATNAVDASLGTDAVQAKILELTGGVGAHRRHGSFAWKTPAPPTLSHPLHPPIHHRPSLHVITRQA